MKNELCSIQLQVGSEYFLDGLQRCLVRFFLEVFEAWTLAGLVEKSNSNSGGYLSVCIPNYAELARSQSLHIVQCGLRHLTTVTERPLN